MNPTTPVVVDTDVVSFLFKAHSLAPAYQAILAGRPLAGSLITLAEIAYGMEAKNWRASRRALMRRFPARFTPLPPNTEPARANGIPTSGWPPKRDAVPGVRLRHEEAKPAANSE